MQEREPVTRKFRRRLKWGLGLAILASWIIALNLSDSTTEWLQGTIPGQVLALFLAIAGLLGPYLFFIFVMAPSWITFFTRQSKYHAQNHTRTKIDRFNQWAIKRQLRSFWYIREDA